MSSGPDDGYQMEVSGKKRRDFLVRLTQLLQAAREGRKRFDRTMMLVLTEMAIKSGYFNFLERENSTTKQFSENLTAVLTALLTGEKDAWELFLGSLLNGQIEDDQYLRPLLHLSPFGDRLNLVVATWPNGTYRILTVIDSSATGDVFNELTGRTQQTSDMQIHMISLPMARRREIQTICLPRPDGR